MSNIELLRSSCLFLTVVFALLWYVTPADHTYETVEMDVVHTRKVFLLLTVLCLAAWLASLMLLP